MTVEDSRHGAHALWGVRPVDHSKLYLSDDGRRPLPAAAKLSFQVMMTVSLLHVVYKK